MKTFVVGLSAVIVSIATIAHAQPSDGETEQRPEEHMELSATAGLATPLGDLGVEGTVVPYRYLEIGLGVGMANIIDGKGVSPEPQVAIMPRVRMPIGRFRFTLGAGLSGGTYTAPSAFDSDPYVARTTALWLNGEAGAQYVLVNGTFVGAYLGFGKVIAHGEIKGSSGNPLMSLPEDALPFAGIKVGRSF